MNTAIAFADAPHPTLLVHFLLRPTFLGTL
jgi:hypothetical protein